MQQNNAYRHELKFRLRWYDDNLSLIHLEKKMKLNNLYMNIDNRVKYMAVHVFSGNDDSLSGSMAHNYYLYESDGRLNLLPWDYNLAFGGLPVCTAISPQAQYKTIAENAFRL